MRIRLLLLALAVVACRGGESAPQRRSIVDSRDNYDPRSLDPALSTDVPTGRAVGYLFDGLTRFTPDAKVEPGARRALGRLARRPDLHLPSPARRHIPRRHAVHRAARRSRAGSARSTPRRRAVAAGRSVRSRARRTSPAGTCEIDRRTRGAERLHRRRHARGAARHLPQDARDAGRLDRARHDPADFGEHPSAPARGSSSSGSTTTTSLRRNPTTGAARRKPTRSCARIIAEPSTAVAEFESGNVDVLQIPQAERADWEETDEKKALLMSTPALELVYVAHQHDARPADATRACARRSTTRSMSTHHRRSSSAAADARGRRRSRRRSTGATRRAAAYAYDPAKAQQLLARRRLPERHRRRAVDSQDADLSRASPRRSRRYLAAVGIRTKIVQREAPRRARPRAKARRT